MEDRIRKAIATETEWMDRNEERFMRNLVELRSTIDGYIETLREAEQMVAEGDIDYGFGKAQLAMEYVCNQISSYSRRLQDDRSNFMGNAEAFNMLERLLDGVDGQ